MSLRAKRSNLKIYRAWELLPVNKQYYIYILTNKRHTVLYTGVTNDLVRRVYEHKEKLAPGFTKNYNVNKLVFYEMTESIESAIMREKQIKGGSRQKKLDLINGMNPQWKDLYEDL
jgi:putative endonuclease